MTHTIKRSSQALSLALLAGMALLAGCSDPPPPVTRTTTTEQTTTTTPPSRADSTTTTTTHLGQHP